MTDETSFSKVYLKPDEVEALREIAARLPRSKSDLIRSAIVSSLHGDQVVLRP